MVEPGDAPCPGSGTRLDIKAAGCDVPHHVGLYMASHRLRPYLKEKVGVAPQTNWQQTVKHIMADKDQQTEGLQMSPLSATQFLHIWNHFDSDGRKLLPC